MRARAVKVPTVKVTLALRPEVVEALRDEARERETTVSELVEEALASRITLTHHQQGTELQ